MSLTSSFDPAATGPLIAPAIREKRPAPFSIRLSEPERTRLAMEAAGAPLGAYIKAKALGEPLRSRRSSLPVQDRRALAQALALLGRSRLANNLNQLAHSANIGALPLDAETVADLHACIKEVRELRRVLLQALGLKPEDLQ
jgi:hypothetical protein